MIEATEVYFAGTGKQVARKLLKPGRVLAVVAVTSDESSWAEVKKSTMVKLLQTQYADSEISVASGVDQDGPFHLLGW